MSADWREQIIDDENALENIFNNPEEVDLIAAGEVVEINDDSNESGVESLENDDFEESWSKEMIDGLDIEDSEASEDEENVCLACCLYKAKAKFSHCGHQCICLKCKYLMELSEAKYQPDDPNKMYQCVKCTEISNEIIRVVY